MADREEKVDNHFAMLGYDEHAVPTAMQNVTIDEAKEIAQEKDLTGMLLAPQDRGAAHTTYMRDDEGKLRRVRMHEWLSAYLTSCSGAEVLERAPSK